MPPKQSTTSAQRAIDNRCQELIRLGKRAPDPQVERELRSALGDAEWRVRAAAARAVVRLGVQKPLTEATLRALLDVAYTDDVTWSWHAAAWTLCELTRHGNPVAVAVANHPPAEWTIHALELAIRLPRGTVAIAPLLDRLGQLSEERSSEERPDWQTRAALAKALCAQAGADARERVADALGNLLEDDDSTVRAAAAKGLGQLGGGRAIDALVGLSTDPEPKVQAMSLRTLGDAVEATDDDLDDDLGNDSVTARLAAVREVLESALSSEHGRVRHAAAALTARLGRHARPLMDSLIDALGDTDRAVADNMGYALVGVARGDPETGPLLWRAVDHEQARVRVRALDLVGHVAPVFPNPHSRSERITQLVLTGLRGRSYESAAWLLQQIPMDHAPTLEVVRENLLSPSVKARWRALSLLARSTDATRDLLPTVRRLLHDPSERVRLEATQLVPSLGRDAQPALPEFVRRAFESDATIRHMARHGLGQIIESGHFPGFLKEWLELMGKKTAAGEFLDARLRRGELPEEVKERFLEATREHAAWHQRVAALRAQKYQREYAVPDAPERDAPLDAHIAHAIAAASARTAIKLSGSRSREQALKLAARREYAWHIGRLIDLYNRHKASH